MENKLIEIYNRLFDRFSYQNWWPADTKDEVVIGAILTQNTSWNSVEKAIENLKKNNLCSLEKIYETDIEIIKENIKPAGFFNQKSIYIKNTATFFVENGGVETLSEISTHQLRRKLLKIKGIGKETADSILLYVFNRAVFVVDAYTKRLVLRHDLLKNLDYDSIQRLFQDGLDRDFKFFNEYHALIVKNAKEFCRKKPLCRSCPLEGA